MGVIFFIYNAIFSTVLLLIVLITTIMAIFSKNPDTRYQPMRDDRGSFIKSQSQLTTELDALGATARGEQKHGASGFYEPTTTTKSGARIEDDEADSWSGNSGSDRNARNQSYANPPHSPIAPVYTTSENNGNGNGRHLAPSGFGGSGAVSPYEQQSRSPSMHSSRSQTRFRGGQNASPSPWQRGAGYE